MSEQKADFFDSVMGKGIMLVSLSLIKYRLLITILNTCSWYKLMRANWERAWRIKCAIDKVPILQTICTYTIGYGEKGSTRFVSWE